MTDPHSDLFLETAKSLVLSLPPENLNLLKEVIDLLNLVTANSDTNKMSTQVFILFFF